MKRRLSPPTVAATALALAAVAVFIVLEVSALHAGDRDYDEGVYWESLRALAGGHPLFASVTASQPPVFYYGVLPFYLLLGHSIVGIRIGILVLAVIALGATYLVGRLLAGPVAGAVAVLLLATDPLFIRQGATVQAEAPALAFELSSVAALLLALRISRTDGEHRSGQPALLASLAGVLFAAGVWTKLSGAVTLLPLVLILLYDRPLNRTRIWAFASGAAAGTGIALIPAFGHWSAAYAQLVRLHLTAGSQGTRGILDNWRLIITHQERALEILALATAVPGIHVFRLGRQIVVPLSWALASVAAILLYEPLYLHHVVLLIPCLALVAGVGVQAIVEWVLLATQARLPRRSARTALSLARAAAPMGALLLVCLAAADTLPVALHQMRSALSAGAHDTTVAMLIRTETTGGAYVVTDNQFAAALANRDVPPSLVDTSGAQVAAHEVDASAIEQAIRTNHMPVVILDSGRLARVPQLLQWLHQTYHDTDPNGQTTIFEIGS